MILLYRSPREMTTDSGILLWILYMAGNETAGDWQEEPDGGESAEALNTI